MNKLARDRHVDRMQHPITTSTLRPSHGGRQVGRFFRSRLGVDEDQERAVDAACTPPLPLVAGSKPLPQARGPLCVAPDHLQHTVQNRPISQTYPVPVPAGLAPGSAPLRPHQRAPGILDRRQSERFITLPALGEEARERVRHALQVLPFSNQAFPLAPKGEPHEEENAKCCPGLKTSKQSLPSRSPCQRPTDLQATKSDDPQTDCMLRRRQNPTNCNDLQNGVLCTGILYKYKHLRPNTRSTFKCMHLLMQLVGDPQAGLVRHAVFQRVKRENTLKYPQQSRHVHAPASPNLRHCGHGSTACAQ